MKKIFKSLQFLFLLLSILKTNAQLKVVPAGDVGIGQSVPLERLHVTGNALIDGTMAKVYFNDDNKTRYLGMATSTDFGLVNKENSWLRIGSKLGIAFWGGTDDADNPGGIPPHMFLNDQGYLGLGLIGTSPLERLHVTGNILLDGYDEDAIPRMLVKYDNHNRYFGMVNRHDMGIINKEPTWLRIGSGQGIAFWGSGDAEASNGIPPHMFLNDRGYLGIGLIGTSPVERLHVTGNILLDGYDETAIPRMLVKNDNYNRYFGMVNLNDMGIINKERTWLRIGSDGGIAFWGTTGSENNPGQPNMILNQYGLGIGNGAQAYASWALFLQGDQYVAGRIYATSSITPYSDGRFKKNIKSINGSLEKILKLNGKSYEFKKDEFPEKNFPDGTAFGFIAQEVREIIPDVVIEDDKGFLAVNYMSIIPFLVEAFKEEHKTVEMQKEEIKQLNLRMEELVADVNTCCNNGSKIVGGNTVNRNDAAIEGINDENRLYQNLPNPFTKGTTIEYYVKDVAKNAQLFVFDLQGGLIKTVNDLGKGKGQIKIDGNEFNAGMYLYSLFVDGLEVDTKRMILSK